jgi:cholesterol transport system auxiliary component
MLRKFFCHLYNTTQAIVIFVSFFFLTGCSLFSPVKTDTTHTYALNSVGYSSIRHTNDSINLLVAPTDASMIYNTKRMVYTTYPHQIAYFAKNFWAVPPAKMLHPLIIRSLQDTHYFHAVSSAPTLGNYQFVLKTQLMELKQEFSNCGTWMHVTLRAQIVGLTDGRVIATKEFSVKQCAPQPTPYGGVVAANKAVARLLTQLTNFCLKAV